MAGPTARFIDADCAVSSPTGASFAIRHTLRSDTSAWPGYTGPGHGSLSQDLESHWRVMAPITLSPFR